MRALIAAWPERLGAVVRGDVVARPVAGRASATAPLVVPDAVWTAAEAGGPELGGAPCAGADEAAGAAPGGAAAALAPACWDGAGALDSAAGALPGAGAGFAVEAGGAGGVAGVP